VPTARARCSTLLGTYAAVAPSDLLLATQSDRHPCDMAMLRGARLVTAQELAPGRAWDEPKLKSLTGGDDITARFMRQDFFTYTPQFLLVAAGNHKPGFRGVDEAVRRRVQLVPFLQDIPEGERDKALPDKLEAEWPAILRWAIEGCLEWQRQGLNPPRSVREASEEYLNAEDVLGQWLEERCRVAPEVPYTLVDALYADWCTWCEGGRLPTGSKKAFSQALGERGFERTTQRGRAAFRGIGLLEPDREPDSRGRGEDGEECQMLPARRAGAHPHTHTSRKQTTSPSSPREPGVLSEGTRENEVELRDEPL
jgi:putative DNA primase/helicase